MKTIIFRVDYPISEPRAETGEQIDIAHSGGTHLITVTDAAKLHQLAFLDLQLRLGKRQACPTVVLTHHAPHPLCVWENRRFSTSAGSLASDLSSLTDHGLAALWVHGHIHRNIDITRPGGTRILCNAAGVGGENGEFQEGYVIEV